MLEGEMCGFWPALHSTNPTKSAPGSLLCLYFTSFFACCTSPLFTPRVQSPRFYIIFCDTFRGCRARVGGYTYQRANWHRAAPISPRTAQAAALRVGQNARLRQHHVITDYTLTHPTILLGHSLKILGRARQLSGDIFYAKDVPRQRALCHPPPTFVAPWVFPKFPPRKKPLHISPFYQTLDTLCYKRRQCLRSEKKRCISLNFTSLPWPALCRPPSLPSDPRSEKTFLNLETAKNLIARRLDEYWISTGFYLWSDLRSDSTSDLILDQFQESGWVSFSPIKKLSGVLFLKSMQLSLLWI